MVQFQGLSLPGQEYHLFSPIPNQEPYQFALAAAKTSFSLENARVARESMQLVP